MFDYTGRKALITGAGQGMGFGIAKALAAQGAYVYINDLYEDRAQAAAKQLTDTGLKVTPLAGDITDASVREDMAKTAGTIDILVNNAGVPISMPTSFAHADKLSDEAYETQMALNFHAVRGLCRLLLPAMRAQNFGRVLIVTSESHRLGVSMGLSHYTAAKAAALGYMRALAAEIAREGVTVNALSLGAMNNFEGHERAAAHTLIGRAGTPEDVGAAAVYLCSAEAAWMTGQTVPLNGGASTA
ncbi:MAG: SDR family NAD(P)-dependent oxidoreductase [Maricaulaceae bacterium]